MTFKVGDIVTGIDNYYRITTDDAIMFVVRVIRDDTLVVKLMLHKNEDYQMEYKGYIFNVDALKFIKAEITEDERNKLVAMMV